MIRTVKIVLVLAVAFWGFTGALHNLIDWQGTLGAVRAVTSMSTFDGGAESWQATSQPLVVWLGALFIMLSKLITACCCGLGALKMWHSKNSDADAFHAAKVMALAGCGVALFMLFTGFIVVAESWFELWRSDVMRGPVLDSAFRYAALITLIALFVANKDSTLKQ